MPKSSLIVFSLILLPLMMFSIALGVSEWRQEDVKVQSSDFCNDLQQTYLISLDNALFDIQEQGYISATTDESLGWWGDALVELCGYEAGEVLLDTELKPVE